MSGAVMYEKVKQQSRHLQEQTLTEHAPLVKRIACHLTGRLPNNVQFDDLVQAGLIGLLEAASNYDASQGASFETYAGIRIRGAMIDEVRRNDWVPRSVHRKARDAAKALQEAETKVGPQATDTQIAALMGVTLAEYQKILQDAAGHRLLSIDDDNGVFDGLQIDDDEYSDPYRGVEMSDYREQLSEAVAKLPEKERLVMGMYYERDMNLKEIGAVLGVSESRICQIHGQAVIRLKARMAQWRSTD